MSTDLLVPNSSGADMPGGSWREELLFTIPGAEKPLLFEVVDRAADRWLLATRAADGDRLVLTGRTFGPYPTVYAEWSRDEETGVVSPPPLAISVSGGRAAWSVDDGDGMRVVVDGVPDLLIAGLSAQCPPVFSPDGAHWAYGAVVDKPRSGKRGPAWLVVDGQVREVLLTRMPIEFSPDGRLVYVESVERGAMRVVVGDSAGPSFARVLPLEDPTACATPTTRPRTTVTFSPSGASFAYIAATDDGMAVALDHVVGVEYVIVGTPTFSETGAHLAYVAARRERRRLRRDAFHSCVVLDGEPGPDVEVKSATLTFDAFERVVYLARPEGSDGRWELYRDHEPTGQSFDVPLIGPFRTPSGRIWVVTSEQLLQCSMVVDGHVDWQWQGGRMADTGTGVDVDEHSVVESPDGGRLGYIVGEKGFTSGGRTHLVLDGSELDLVADDRFWSRGQAFSADGRWAAVSVLTPEGIRPWVEQHDLGPAGVSWNGPWWTGSTVRFVGLRDRRLLRAELDLM